jgi:hypothetical protein
MLKYAINFKSKANEALGAMTSPPNSAGERLQHFPSALSITLQLSAEKRQYISTHAGLWRVDCSCPK